MLVLLGGVMQVSAISGTVYYAINTEYTMKLWVRYGTYDGDAEQVITMSDTGRSFKGLKIYSASFGNDNKDGVGIIEFQAFNGNDYQWGDRVLNNVWTTDLDAYNGKIKEANVSGMQDYHTDGVRGYWDSWLAKTEFVNGQLTKSFNAGDYIHFKIDVAGTRYGAQNSGATMFWNNCTDWTLNSTSNDCVLQASVTGTYTFTLVGDKKVSITFPSYTGTKVYFYNTLVDWSAPYAYILTDNYWDDVNGKGSGSNNQPKGVAMTQVGSSNVYEAEYPAGANSGYIAFVKTQQNGYDNFWDTEAIYKRDFPNTPCIYVPNASGTTENLNEGKTKYYKEGEWHAYPTYTRSTTEGKFGTICLPFDATVDGATVYSLDSKVMDGSNLKGVNLSVVENLEAGKSYIFKATGTTLTATYSDSYSDAIAGAMVGNLSSTAKSVPEGDYIIYNNSITKAGTGVTIGQYRGYIDISVVPEASALSKDFIAVDGEEETDGINSVHGVELNSSEMYNLSGQKVSSNYKGIVIQNGKKLINK